jgi:Predicted transcriptional regulators
MHIGDKIKQARINRGLTQVELAHIIDVSKQTLYKYENGIVTNIPSDKIELIAKILHISPAYLMGWDNTSNSILLSPAERELVIAYRNANSGIRTSIRKLLDIEESATERRSSTSADIETA